MLRHFSIIFWVCSLLYAVRCTPVLIWNAKVNPKAVFPQIEQQEFIQEIKPLHESKTIVAFTYDKLRLSDFRCSDCFSYLSTQTPTFFYANVKRPIEALRSLRPTGQFSIEADGRWDHTVECQPGKLYLISLYAFKYDTNPMLSCDITIKNIATSTTCQDVVYAFLGAHEEPSEPSGHLYQSGKLSFYITKLHIDDTDGLREIEFQKMNVTGEDPKLLAELPVENSTATLQFYVDLSGGYFQINSFKLNETIYYVSNLNAPTTHSYACGKIALASNKKKLIFKRIQIQYDTEPQHGYFRFHDAWTCEGFTSPAIASGLFVTAILVAILSVGISMLMSVQAPTKFESAVGPTIHVNVVK